MIGIGTGLFFSPNNALLLANAPPERAGMVSGLFGTIRQAGYAFGFALIASLFAATQDFYETNWTHTGFGRLTPDAAGQLTDIFDGGGIWSPEMLVFILRVSAIVCAAILLVALINSLPRVRDHRQAPAGGARRECGRRRPRGLRAAGRWCRAAWWWTSRLLPRCEAAAPPPVAAFGMPARAALVAAETRPQRRPPAAVSPSIASGCHGGDGRGLPGLGVNLVESAYVRQASAAELGAFLRKGRMPGEPGNVTGRPMPAFEWLGDETLAELVKELKNWSG